MYLRKLEIHGFKSFAKKTVLEFQPGIISVVGPNGSGKSNIADSLRWVFGEQSMKLLRSKKSDDVIFAGSDSKARLGAAEVSVTFDNTDRIMPIDYAEVVIMRRLYRDATSEYLINGTLVRLLDIQELLSKSGFGNTSYHVIGQGMIDGLILGGPAAIKELIEEASGVKPYYQKRESTLRKLDRTGVNLKQVEALVFEIEPRLRSLRRQTRKFEQREEIAAELRAAQLVHYGQIFRGLDQQSEEVNAKISTWQKQTAELGEEIAKLKIDIESQEKNSQDDSASYKKLRHDVNELHKQKLALQEEQAMRRGKLRALRETSATPTLSPNWQDIKNGFNSAFRKFHEFLKNLDLLGRDPETARKTAKEIEGLLESVSKKLEEPEIKAKEQSELLKKEEDRLTELENELTKLFTKIEALERDLEKYTESEHGTKQQLFVKERLLRNKQDTLVKTNDQKNVLSVEQAKILTRIEAYEKEAATALGTNFREAMKEAGHSVGGSGVQEKIQKLQKQLEMIGGVDDMVMQEYKETEDRYQYLTTQSEDLNKAVADLKSAIEELDVVIKKEFHDALDQISEKFTEYFRVLFGGGRATMTIMRERPNLSPTAPSDSEEIGGDEEGVEIPDESKPQITGIDIRATPPGKKLGGIAALSGGERALTAIALLSSILATYPSPFVVLDEVDAALDEANSIRFGKIIGTLAHRTQFITITHNRETMRQSHTLYGITMGEDGISKILSLKLEQAAIYSTKN